MMRIKLSEFLFFLLVGFMLTGTVFGQDEASKKDLDSKLILEGKVLNQLSLPVAGVSVSVEGSREVPSVSDENGAFSLSMPAEGVWINISPPQIYKKRRMYVENRRDIVVYLTDISDLSLDDVIQHPGGTRPLKYSTSPVQVPDIQTIPYFPIQSVDQFLKGMVPGMQVTGLSGMPGSGAYTTVRGNKSMYSNSQPLYVIDGIPIESNGIFGSEIDGYAYNPLASIDPNDITSIHVHSDNNAGMFYGMRGSNGVVMIETLKPSEVRTIIDFGYRMGIRTSPREIPQLNATQHRSLANEVLYSSNAIEEEFMSDYPGLFLAEGEEDYFRYNHNTNWQNEIFQNALFTDTYFRVRGGDQIARYGLSVGYLKHNGIITNTDMDRLNIRFIGTFSIFKWLRMYVSSNLSNSNSNHRDAATFQTASPILTALYKSPMLSPYSYNRDGDQNLAYQDVSPFGISNPSVIRDNVTNRLKNNRFLTSFRFEGDLGPSLKVNSVVGFNYVNSGESSFMPDYGMELYYGDNVDDIYNYASSMKNLLTTFYNNTYLGYKNSIGNAGEIYLAGGVITDINSWEEDFARAYNSNQNDQYRSLQSGIDSWRRMKGGVSEKWNRLGVYSTAMYVHKERYILNAGINSQFSSRMGKSIPSEKEGVFYVGTVPFGLFYNAGLAWRLSNEVFMQNLDFVDDLKLRLSWGTSGNDDVGNSAGMRYYSPVLFQGSSGFIPANLSENNLSFEKNGQLNAGIDLYLLRNRLGLSLNAYKIYTSDMLIYRPMESYTGFNAVPENGCDMVTQGLELQANLRLIRSRDFTWDLMLNFATSDNTITAITNDAIVTTFEGGSYISEEGNSLLNFYGYIYDGVYSTNDEAEQADMISKSGIPYRAGDAIFRDLKGRDPESGELTDEGDHIIDENDRTIIGSPIPDYFGGLISKISWRRWSVYTRLNFVYGNEVFNYLRYKNERMSSLANQSAYTLNRWQYDGHETNVPRALWDDPVGNSAFSSRWIEDGSYLKLSNLSLSYRLPDNIGLMRNAEIFVSAENLLTISRSLGYDPEFSFSYQNMEQGIDYGQMPHTKSYMLGVKLGF